MSSDQVALGGIIYLSSIIPPSVAKKENVTQSCERHDFPIVLVKKMAAMASLRGT
jgi:hypothetical protein